MNTITYEQRVQAIVEEMVRYNTVEDMARIAVKHMAAAYKEGWKWGYEDGIDTEGNYCYDRKKKMIEWGLTPDIDQEAGQDEKG